MCKRLIVLIYLIFTILLASPLFAQSSEWGMSGMVEGYLSQDQQTQGENRFQPSQVEFRMNSPLAEGWQGYISAEAREQAGLTIFELKELYVHYDAQESLQWKIGLMHPSFGLTWPLSTWERPLITLPLIYQALYLEPEPTGTAVEVRSQSWLFAIGEDKPQAASGQRVRSLFRVSYPVGGGELGLGYLHRSLVFNSKEGLVGLDYWGNLAQSGELAVEILHHNLKRPSLPAEQRLSFILWIGSHFKMDGGANWRYGLGAEGLTRLDLQNPDGSQLSNFQIALEPRVEWIISERLRGRLAFRGQLDRRADRVDQKSAGFIFQIIMHMGASHNKAPWQN